MEFSVRWRVAIEKCKIKSQARGTTFEDKIIDHLGEDNGNLYKSCRLVGKTTRNMNEVLGSMPWEIIYK